MGKLKILAAGQNLSAQSNARGHLFEDLISDVLRHYGYTIQKKPNVNYAGMEIDVEGALTLTGTQLYAECKCYDKELDAPKFHIFIGKYMSMWLQDNHCQGIFFAIPNVNSAVRGLYNTKFRDDKRLNIKIINEDDVVNALLDSGIICSRDIIIKQIHSNIGEVGDWDILYTDHGIFWKQFIITQGFGIPNAIMFFDSKGNLIDNNETIEYFSSLDSEIKNFEILRHSITNFEKTKKQIDFHEDQIVEVKEGSEYFEYQYPSAPRFFVGRKNEILEIESFLEKVIKKETSSRGLTFEANSGLGKSSLALMSVDIIQKKGHFALVVDSRTATSPQFVLKMIEHSIKKFGNFHGFVPEGTDKLLISGFDGGVEKLLNIASELEKHEKLLVIILDQFENILYLEDTLKRIRDLFFKISDSQSNVILGFSWKTDLIGSTNEFPFEIRESIKNMSKRIFLHEFNDQDTADVLSHLEQEIRPRRKLTEDLKFFISDGSQGFPWRLKKLCSHVKSQIERGLSQEEIVTRMLNIVDLFQEDLDGLDPEQRETLYRIAKKVPISVQDLNSGEFKPKIVQSLIYAKLVVNLGPIFDIYWDNFRDFLNSGGHLPIQENYLLRTSPGSVVKAIQILNETRGKLPTSEFIEKANLTKHSFYNVARDMRLLGLVQIDNEEITLNIDLPEDFIDINYALKPVINEKIQYNRLVKGITDELKLKEYLTLSDVSKIMSKLCPYILASEKTWEKYGIILLTWIDFAGLVSYDKYSKEIRSAASGTLIKRDNLILPRRRSNIQLPSLQVPALHKMMLRIYNSSVSDKPFDVNDISKEKYRRLMLNLEDL